jgi:hypothetical protein
MPNESVKYINRESLLKQRNLIFRHEAETKEERILIEGLRSLLAAMSEYRPGEQVTFIIQ